MVTIRSFIILGKICMNKFVSEHITGDAWQLYHYIQAYVGDVTEIATRDSQTFAMSVDGLRELCPDYEIAEIADEFHCEYDGWEGFVFKTADNFKQSSSIPTSFQFY